MLKSLCVFGDSVCKGVVLDECRNRYAFLKESFANSFAAATGVAVDNFSKFGCTTRKGLEIVTKHSDRLSDYDFVILEFGGNDCNFDWAKIAEAPEAFHDPDTPIGQFAENYRKIIESVRKNGGRPVLINLPPLVSEKFFRWVSRGLNADNILKWLKDVEFIYKWQANYSNAVGRIARITRTPLIDIRGAFLRSPDYRKLICEDGMHPNPDGHRLIFDTVLRYANKKGVIA